MEKETVQMEKKKEIRKDQIDLLELFYALKKRILVIIVAALAGALIALAYTKLLVTPLYSATATMLVLSNETTSTSLSDLQLGSQLTTDYSRLITSHSVLQQVIENLGLDMSPNSLESSISTNNPSGTRIMEITVTNPDAKLAQELATEVGKISAEFIGEQMEISPPKIIEEAELPTAPVSPNVNRNVMVGAMAGIVIVAGVICLMVIMDDTIKSEDDIVQYLGVPALASIPDRRDFISGTGQPTKKRKKKKRRRRHR